ncbi:unannotated protein [freshwater metagenome]|uniref:Unannotated protein n=1 Tax=freshwater metagenome TaxID=449393 RepID=A0A6J7XU61_9ZZZZ|nr:rhodanese-like domain-containing protein [Actinomycetota bacterium]
MITKKVLLLLITPMLFLTACSSGTTSAITNLDASSFSSLISGDEVTVIDVRTADEFLSGHIAKAINIDVEASTFNDLVSKLNKSKKYAVYCHSGRRSAIATSKMSDLGFSSVNNLNGGVEQWIASGFTLTTQ